MLTNKTHYDAYMRLGTQGVKFTTGADDACKRHDKFMTFLSGITHIVRIQIHTILSDFSGDILFSVL